MTSKIRRTATGRALGALLTAGLLLLAPGTTSGFEASSATGFDLPGDDGSSGMSVGSGEGLPFGDGAATEAGVDLALAAPLPEDDPSLPSGDFLPPLPEEPLQPRDLVPDQEEPEPAPFDGLGTLTQMVAAASIGADVDGDGDGVAEDKIIKVTQPVVEVLLELPTGGIVKEAAKQAGAKVAPSGMADYVEVNLDAAQQSYKEASKVNGALNPEKPRGKARGEAGYVTNLPDGRHLGGGWKQGWSASHLWSGSPKIHVEAGGHSWDLSYPPAEVGQGVSIIQTPDPRTPNENDFKVYALSTPDPNATGEFRQKRWVLKTDFTWEEVPLYD